MAGIKARGVITNHLKRYHKEKEIIPCKYIADGKGKGIMVAQYKESRDLVVDDLGKPIAWNRA